MIEIPAGWTQMKVRDVCLPVAKMDPVDLGRSHFAYVDIGSIESGGLTVSSPQRLAVQEAPSRARQVLACGDTVFSTVRPYLMKIAWIPNTLDGEIASTGFCVLRPNQDLIDSRFLFYFATSDALLDQVLPLQRGVSYPAVRDGDVLSASIHLPPVDEQRRIVAILEDHLSRLDVGGASLKRVRDLGRVLRQSLANDLSAGWYLAPELRGQRDGNGRFRLAPGWSWRSVEEIAGGVKSNVAIGPFGSNLKVSDYTQSGTPLVFVRNIRTGNFLPDGQPHVSPEKAAELASHLAQPGDVLITKMGDPPGDAAVYTSDHPAVITSDCLRLRPTEGYLPEYLAMAVASDLVHSQILSITSGVAQKKISLERFRARVLIPCPDVSVQTEVVERFRAATEEANRLMEQPQLSRMCEVLRKALLASAFSGQLTKETAHV